VDLREVLQNGTAADLRDVMAQAILKKPMEHCFERPKDMTEHHLMSGIGG
jgi:cyclic pyranopterin phosphate synthase